jgi:hypothetical protein
MNTIPLPDPGLPGFKVVSKHRLGDVFSPSHNAYYILLGRRGDPAEPHDRIVFVNYLDHFLTACQREIEDLWIKHRVLITHVGVKLRPGRSKPRHDFSQTYERAVAVKHLREKLNPLFRRV